VFRASFRFLEIALLIGTMELRIGINMPIARAIVVAYQSGITEGVKPMSSVNNIAYTAAMQGSEKMKPKMTEGITNRAAWVMIIPMKPSFVRPTSLMTPNSNYFVSTVMRRSE